MKCPSKEQLSQWIDASIEDPDNSELKKHLASCAMCREEVEEQVWLDRLGRASMRAIQVDSHHTPADCSTPKRQHHIYTLAKVAAILLLFPLLFWKLNTDHDTPNQRAHDIQSKPKRHDAPLNKDIDVGEVIDGKSNTAYERWIEPYRQLRIPLVPLEDLAENPIYSTIPFSPVVISTDDEA